MLYGTLPLIWPDFNIVVPQRVRRPEDMYGNGRVAHEWSSYNTHNINQLNLLYFMGALVFQGGSIVKNPPAEVGDAG